MEELYRYFTLSASPLMNLIIILLCFPLKRSKVLSYTLFGVCFLQGILVSTLPAFEQYSPLSYISLAVPMILVTLFCLKVHFFQIMYTLWSVSIINLIFVHGVSPIVQVFFGFGTSLYYLSLVLSVSFLYVVFVAVFFLFLRSKVQMVFRLQGKLWILYSCGPFISRLCLSGIGSGVITVSQTHYVAPGEMLAYYGFLAAALWCFASTIIAIYITYRQAETLLEKESMKKLLNSERHYYQELQQYQESERIYRHNVKFTMNAMREMVSQRQYEDLAVLLKSAEIEQDDQMHYCANIPVDALISHYASLCRMHDIKFTARLLIPQFIPFDPNDICILLGNLLENALTACCRLKNRERFITLEAGFKKNTLSINIRNAFNGEILTDGSDNLVSMKNGGGIGLQSVANICANYEGSFYTDWTEREFTVLVMLNGHSGDVP